MSILAPILFILSVFLALRAVRRQKNLPPGPRGWPIIGNILDMPKHSDWLTYAEWGRQYGPITSVSLLGTRLVVVNSGSVMEELDSKGAVFSDRPRLEMAGELMGYNNTIVLLQYSTRLKIFRRHIAKMIGTTSAMSQFYPMVEAEMKKHIKRMLVDPSQLKESLLKSSGGMILSITYGIEVQEKDDPFVNLIEESNANFGVATVPGTFLVDVIPALRHLPEWLPGADFKRLAKEWSKILDRVFDVPYNYTKARMAEGTAPPSFVANSLANEEELSATEIRDIKHTAGSLYGAGADTTVSTQCAFVLAMILHPDVQAKAHAEIDSVVGRERLPSLADRDSLPYLNAIVTELLRWNVVTPTGFPHMVSQDSILGGYFVPKGTMILTNTWNMMHDPEVYPDPFTFEPARHLGDSRQRDPRHACFGYARRYCPGSHMAEAAVFMCVAMMLATFEIKKAVVDEVDVVPVHEQSSGTVSHPKPFSYALKTRNGKIATALLE